MPAALVTGASARIGLAIAERLARSGFAVALHASARSLQRAAAEAERLRAAGHEAVAVAGDLAEPDACRAVISAAQAALGALDLLVNNAAVFEPDSFGALEIPRWDRQFAINLRAPVLLAEVFAAAMPRHASADRAIVNLVDQRVLRPGPQHLSYTLSKAALWTATQVLAEALAPMRIRVNAVGPGPVLANKSEGVEGLKREIEALPLRSPISPGEIADAVLYLARAASVTGQFIAVDGGQHLAGAGQSARPSRAE